MFSPLFEKALRVAARAHRQQLRKASDLPYITHPFSVAMILIRAGFRDDYLLAAALLHDTIEDTDYSVAELTAEFPPQVTEYVALTTERKLDDTGRKRSWLSRKTEHIAVVAQSPQAVRAITLADKLHNLGTTLYDLEAGEDIWSRFHATPEQVLWYHRTMIQSAAGSDPALVELADACRELVARLDATLRGERGT